MLGIATPTLVRSKKQLMNAIIITGSNRNPLRHIACLLGNTCRSAARRWGIHLALENPWLMGWQHFCSKRRDAAEAFVVSAQVRVVAVRDRLAAVLRPVLVERNQAARHEIRPPPPIHQTPPLAPPIPSPPPPPDTRHP